MPSRVILAVAWRSAEQDTPMPIGQLAPWRGNRMTRTSWQKYLPPNCAPMPISRVICRIRCSHSRSRKAWPLIEPDVGSPSRYRVEASLTRSEEHTSELQSLMRISYAVFCLKKKTQQHKE